MSHRFFILITCLTLFLGSCSNLPEIVESAEPIPFLAGDSTPIPAALVIAPPDATPTSTPFLPIAPPPTPAPTPEELDKMGWQSPIKALTGTRITGITDPRVLAAALAILMIALYVWLR